MSYLKFLLEGDTANGQQSKENSLQGMEVEGGSGSSDPTRFVHLIATNFCYFANFPHSLSDLHFHLH